MFYFSCLPGNITRYQPIRGKVAFNSGTLLVGQMRRNFPSSVLLSCHGSTTPLWAAPQQEQTRVSYNSFTVKLLRTPDYSGTNGATLPQWSYRSCLVTEKLLEPPSITMEPVGPLYHNRTTGAAWLQKNYWNHFITMELPGCRKKLLEPLNITMEPMGPLYYNGTTGTAWLQKNHWNLRVLQWNQWGHFITLELQELPGYRKTTGPNGPLYHNGTTGAAWLQKNHWNQWGHFITVELQEMPGYRKKTYWNLRVLQ